jgi:hypothetical protein
MSNVVTDNYIIKSLLSDLYNVGSSKSLGYLPLSTLTEVCNTSIQDIIDYSNTNNLGYLLYTQEESGISSGAIFVYDETMLLNILQTNKKILVKAKIPTDNVIDYINYTNKVFVPEEKYPLAYKVIGKTFNDPRFR